MEHGQAGGPPLLAPGMQVGPWRVLRGSGLGVYGFIYRVERVGQERAGTFALKMARHPADPRFEREAELLARVYHPHVPRLHDRGEWVSPGGASFPYLVMDWVEGLTLYAWASRQPRSLREQLRVLAQVARALEATHAAGGVHRDVKGENVLVRSEDGAAMLMDFGSGNYLGASVLTRHPQPPGTPQYQSPESQRFELAHAAEPTARYKARPADDVYSLGMMAYRLTTGRYPPPALKLEVTAGGGPRLQLVPLTAGAPWAGVRPELAALLQRMLSDDPSARGTAGEVAQALEQLSETVAPTQRPPAAPRRALTSVPWLAAAAGVLLAVSAGWGMRWALERRAEHVAPEASTSGLGEERTGGPASGEPPQAAPGGFREEVPKKPIPNQLRPPCKKPLVEIHKGCWAGPSEEKPPCSLPSYEWKGQCYWAITHSQDSSTSSPP